MRDFASEYTVIAHLLEKPSLLPVIELETGDFAEPRCAKIWETVCDLYADHGPAGVDPITVAEAGGLELDVLLKLMAEWCVTSVTVPYHADVVRRQSADRQLRAAAADVLRSPEEGEDLYEFARKTIMAVESKSARGAVTVAEVTKRLQDELAAAQSGTPPDRLRWGSPQLDKFLSLPRGGVLVVGARPGGYKSLLMGWIAERLTGLGESLLRVTTELEHYEDHRRTVAQAARVDANDWLISYRLDQEGYARYTAKLKEIGGRKIWYLSRTTRLRDVVREIKRLRRIHGITCVEVDHINEMCDPPTAGQGRRQELDSIWRGLRDACQEKEGGSPATLICAAECTRPPRDRAARLPTMNDFKGSGKAEEIADVAVLIHDPYKDDKDEPSGEILLLVDKNRHGPVGALKFRFDRAKGHVLGLATSRAALPQRAAPQQQQIEDVPKHWMDDYD